MQRDERARRAKLGSVLGRLDAAEARALADLRAAGYSFRTVQAARSYRARLVAVERFERDGDTVALTEALQGSGKTRRAA